ncbi:PREDICTED: uncharacterized protein LOC106815876 [Priapulus caudatus]|uniref:Uncharacterized protein LOC106815876 n=1 Tax=Priapulus caudatus TaxID=37621 RepID=A0ABM1EUL6_PRICU|nr:PREDICTED: uncharacterized protein LOC106815876 [Priapulus caudatus]
MKKTTSYKVDIKLDSNGVVLETQCECAVGQGPSAHCKHVGCTLHALSQFCEVATIITEVTCTQVLQSFHQAKPHKGSPMKMRRLNEVRGKSRSLIYDPRPTTRRDPQQIQQHFRQVVLNYQGKARLPVFQLFAPADITTLGLDHDYMELTMEENFLLTAKLS